MASKDAQPELGEQLIDEAVTNYIECLKLPEGSNVLVVRDLPAKDSAKDDPNLAIRRKVSTMVARRLFMSGVNLTGVEFDNSASEDDFYTQTQRVLNYLTDGNPDTETITTVVYLGDSWDNRGGMYKAVSDFGQSREVRVVGSLGFSTGDCRVMSQLTAERRKKIAEVNDYFEDFLTENPSGIFEIETTDTAGNVYKLEISYNHTLAPFKVDLGEFSAKYVTKVLNFTYINTPGGERFAAPYPFEKSKGQYVAQGIVFSVADGLVYKVAVPEGVEESLGLSQKLLLTKIKQGQKIPLAELGLGFYAIAGVETYSDSSILSGEKKGPHSGIGQPATKDTPEYNKIKDHAGDFYHTDFFMDNPIITHRNPETNERKHFYPPTKK